MCRPYLVHPAKSALTFPTYSALGPVRGFRLLTSRPPGPKPPWCLAALWSQGGHLWVTSTSSIFLEQPCEEPWPTKASRVPVTATHVHKGASYTSFIYSNCKSPTQGLESGETVRQLSLPPCRTRILCIGPRNPYREKGIWYTKV